MGSGSTALQRIPVASGKEKSSNNRDETHPEHELERTGSDRAAFALPIPDGLCSIGYIIF